MIFGRPTNLWIAAIGALFNAFVLFHIGGFDPNADQIVGSNALIFAFVGLIANTRNGNAPSVLAGHPR